MHPFIAYYARPGDFKARIDNVIEFLNSYYLGLRCKGQLDNNYNF